jgi:hypothetical protein
MIEFVLHRPQASLDISEALSVSQLSKRHAQKLIQTGKRSDSIISAVSPNTFAKIIQGQIVHYLRKYGSVAIHEHSLDWNAPTINRVQIDYSKNMT